MNTLWSSLGVMGPLWGQRKTRFLIFYGPKRNSSFVRPVVYCSNDGALPQQSQLGYDPSEEILGVQMDLKSRNVMSGSPKQRSWFGPNGQYIKELPCPSCRGRGYTPCTECGIERSGLHCAQCSGKGIMTCHQCLGDCVVWEESIDERPWENARSM
uniref:Uncharacterized protein MANES_01G189400 n=1 Tax=Rhizophora mucronata TaxID=61149 RepID=A0A2P2KQ83_RHIMU